MVARGQPRNRWTLLDQMPYAEMPNPSFRHGQEIDDLLCPDAQPCMLQRCCSTVEEAFVVWHVLVTAVRRALPLSCVSVRHVLQAVKSVVAVSNKTC